MVSKMQRGIFWGVDGAFMKGPFLGQLLTTIGLDSNKATYPIAYAIVEAETISSWTCFLELLGDDMDLTIRSSFPFISDRRKGIIPTIAKVFPSSEHKFYLSWKGKELKDQLWICIVATVLEFESINFIHICVRKLICLDHIYVPYANSFLHDHTRKSRTDRHSLLNNICETFNKQLVEARDNPIITCLDYIREYLLRKIGNVNLVIQKAIRPLTPTKVLKYQKEVIKYTAIWNGGHEVNGPWSDNFIVDIRGKVSSCRRWELNGTPCKHIVATISKIWTGFTEAEVKATFIERMSDGDHFSTSFKGKPQINGKLRNTSLPSIWTVYTCCEGEGSNKNHVNLRKSEEQSQSLISRLRWT
ncbi:LOW QUALITY PROTEIN: hypothetical protein OSB04_001745 [Centaurea solstitialis]|uniref:SWIM-type domain-containing protein n=1 Tax=Centaurea solstitialis TaxID=347529 RepID=A0AA38TTD0_9ASTR|nr:LOW QUALITY PROTEIN: hypothetical protein OSB04_001745 [Centaurea solstitialis]